MSENQDEEEVALARAELRERLRAILGEHGAEGTSDIPALDQALTHRSYANERGVADNQRLEFLGDAVLGLCVSQILVAAHESADEGRLSRMRSALVNASALASWARRVNLGACLALGRGARSRTERDETNVLADGVEAIVAAVYEARGMEGARALVAEIVSEAMASPEALDERDPKGMLQERLQARAMGTPSYRVVETRGGPPGQIFDVEVVLGETVLGRGDGRSKRLAEKLAAMDALARLAAEDL